jgi:radical SAM protein with 4Fe4S-binding SPASM domain
MRFSVDGATQETYQKNRVGGKFDRVHRNMKMMVDMAQERKSDIRLEWQMIALKNNEHEIAMAEGMAREIGINFFVKSFAVTDPELMPVDIKYHRKLHLKPCIDIYRAMFVYWTGEVVPCCYDQGGSSIMGNLKENTLVEIWESELYKDLRHRIDNAHLEPENEPEMCKSCLKWGSTEKATANVASAEEEDENDFV